MLIVAEGGLPFSGWNWQDVKVSRLRQWDRRSKTREENQTSTTAERECSEIPNRHVKIICFPIVFKRKSIESSGCQRHNKL